MIPQKQPKKGFDERQGIARGNDWLVPVRAGETIEIWGENRSGRTVCMRLLVDGLNTLPEPETVKGVTTTIWGKRVRLEEAKFHILDEPERLKLFRVSGFAPKTGVGGEIKPFVVVPAERSLAARRRFSDQIGLIPAAFYTPESGTRQLLGIDAGEARP